MEKMNPAPHWHYVYLLASKKDMNKIYMGCTNDLHNRLKEHNEGKNYFTKRMLPIELIYFEACINEEDARRREEYLKSTKGHRFLAKRLKTYFKSKL